MNEPPQKPVLVGPKRPSVTTLAAVLVPLFPGRDGPEVLLTRRAEHLRMHAGQISFPGGRHDPQHDASLVATALREAEEEIGLPGTSVEILGALEPVITMSSRFEINPFVGRLAELPPLRLHAGEVAEAFRMPLAAHADPRLRVTHGWQRNGVAVEVPGLRYQGHLIWGATLRILDLLAEALERREIVV
jgi:8-oxo-dGTP pyrophosphatase MutT (NUDIX family)